MDKAASDTSLGHAAALPEAVERSTGEKWIVDRVFTAVMEHRLPPGTKLSEHALCEAFGVSRARVRRALLMLAERGIAELHSNRGAFVASPSPKEAKDVFEARRAIEPTVVKNAVARVSERQLKALEEHVGQEAEARHAGDRHQAIRLSGEFHVKLAEFSGSPALARIVGDLVARTSLIIGLFGSPGLSSCSEDEHRGLIQALADRNADRGMRLMGEHLDKIEGELEIRDDREAATDLRKILNP